MVVGMVLGMVGMFGMSEGFAQQAGWRASGQTVAADSPGPASLPPLPDATALPAPKPAPNQAQTEKPAASAAPKNPVPEASSGVPGGTGSGASAKNNASSPAPGAVPAPGALPAGPAPGGSALSILDTPSADAAQFCPAPAGGRKPSCYCPEDVPYMFGDSLMAPGQVFAGAAFTPGVTPYADIPLAGGARRVKIAENNRLMPTDRVYLQYNHFHNAFERFDAAGTPGVASLDQYTLGIEKTFLDVWSCEVRMPFTGAYQADMAPTINLPGLGVSTSHYGNLAVILKRHLAAGDWWALGGGVGVDIPIGSDVQGFIDGTPFAIDNEAVHLLPFGAAVVRPTERLFGQAFIQVDTPLNSNRVVLDATPIGELTEQTLLYVDAGIGYWLYQNRCAKWLTGLAGVVEVHYTTPLQDADVFAGTVGVRTLGVGNVWNRMDVVNLTLGLHAEFSPGCTLGVGGVVPLDDRPDRAFDAEVQVFFNYRY